MLMRARIMIIRHLATSLTAACAMIGCGDEQPAEKADSQVLEAVATAQSEPAAEFSGITGIGVDSRGNIYAGDRLSELLVLDGSGKLIRRLGGLGGGPGEFQGIGAVHLLSNDSLFVYDPAAQRATVYAPYTDRVAYTIRFPMPDFSFPLDVQPMRNGVLSAHFRRINGDVPITGQRRDDLIRHLNRDGSIRRDTVLVVPEPDVLEVRTKQNLGYYLPRFGRQTLVRWGPDGRIYSLWTDSLRVSIHDQTGRARGGFTARLSSPRLALTDATIDSAARLGSGPGIGVRTLSEAFRARWQTWPMVEDMLVDDQSRVWIMPVTHAPFADWLAFRTDGTQLAALRLPRAVHPRLIRGDRLYAVSKDSLDVESLVVYRLTPTSTPTPGRP